MYVYNKHFYIINRRTKIHSKLIDKNHNINKNLQTDINIATSSTHKEADINDTVTFSGADTYETENTDR